MQLKFKSLKREIKLTVLLSVPISLGQLGHVITGVADYTMLGHTKPLDMAGATFATSVFFPIMILGLGFGLGLTPIVAKANGAKDWVKLKALFKTNLKINLLSGLGLFGFLFWLGGHLDWFNQPEDVLNSCQNYFLLISISIVPIMVFQALKTFLEGLKDTLTPMIISLLSNVLNVFLNYLFIFDHGSFGGMGIEGAGWATLISRVFMVVVFMGVYLWRKNLREILLSSINKIFDFQYLKEIINIGLPISVYMFFEVTAFSAATFMMGWISDDHISAHQAALSLASISFVICMGVGNAGSIRSATYVGENRLRKVKGVVISVVAISFFLSLIAAVLFLTFKDTLPLIFVNAEETQIIKLSSVMLLYAALFQFSDGLQVVFQGLLQGIGDVKIPSLIAVASYWLVGLPVGYYLTFNTEVGYPGVWIGLSLGLTISAILQITRYKYSFRNLINRM